MSWKSYTEYRRNVSDFRTAASSPSSKKLLIITIISKLVVQDISVAYGVAVRAKMPFFRSDDRNEFLLKLREHLDSLPSGTLFWLNKGVADVGVPKPVKAVRHSSLIEAEKTERRAENYARDRAYYQGLRVI